MTMQLVQHIELSSSAASITFSSIPQDGTDLMLAISARTGRAEVNDAIAVKLNNSTANYSNRILQGNGSSVTSGTAYFGQGYFLAACNAANATSSTFGNAAVYIPNYTASASKSISSDFVVENNATTAYQTILAGLWADNTAISSIVLSSFSGTDFVAGSSATLYKITKGSIPGITIS